MINLSGLLFADEFDKATTYEEWLKIAAASDKRRGLLDWRKADKTDLYDYESIRQRLTTLQRLRRQGKDKELLFTLNEGLHGNIDGIANPSLYRKAKGGTKALVEQYIEEVVACLQHIVKTRTRSITKEQKIDFFDRAAHCYGSTALMLSGAGALGFFHLGAAQALYEQNLLPPVISGSSAGSLVAATIGSRTDDELDDLLASGKLEDYIQEQQTLLGNTDRSKRRRLATADVVRQIELWIPDLTFQEAFDISNRHINITVSATRRHQKSRLLNAITSPNVLLRSAVQASCAVPGIYPPVALLARDASNKIKKYLPKETWVDGSLASDLPARRLSRLYGVNHYVASQVNPFVLWSLIELRSRDGILSGLLNLGLRVQKEWLYYLRASSAKLLNKSPEISYLVDSVFSVASQEYTGDINIVPRFRFFDPRKLLSHLSEGDRNYLIYEGRRASWPKIEMIRNSSRIGQTLRDILADYGHDVSQLSLSHKREIEKKRRRSASAA